MNLRWIGPALAIVCAAQGQSPGTCSCGANPPGRPPQRVMTPYAQAPDDLRPFSKYTKPYYENYTKTIEYNGGAREVPDPDLKALDAIRIAFLGPLSNHPDEKLGRMMLHGAELAVEEANARGGYGGKPFKLLLHNDSALWGASSNEIVKMTYDEQVWGMLGSISGDTTHIALRVSLKSELPIVNSASTDPTIPETIIPWYFTTIQDDRLQSYTLARRIYTDLGLKRVAILRVNDRYGRFGVLKFRDASRRLGRPVVIEQKFLVGDSDFTHQLKVIDDSRVDAIVLWADAKYAGGILKRMHELGMKQRVFGSFRTYGDDLFEIAGDAAEGMEFVFPYDPNQDRPAWVAFKQRFTTKFEGKQPDVFASLAYEAMNVLLDSICRAGLNRGRIRDAFTAIEQYHGVTSDMVMDVNCKNISPLYLGTIRAGRKVDFRRYPMQLPYAQSSATTPAFTGPPPPDAPAGPLNVVIFGANANQFASDPKLAGYHVIPVVAGQQWGKSSNELVRAMTDSQTIAVIATDRNSSHLAEQLGNRLFIPVLAVSSDRALTSMGVPWIFRMPTVDDAVGRLIAAVHEAGPNRGRIRDALARNRIVAVINDQRNPESHDSLVNHR
jgi:ABC-type branched-subunit amino acid transport system substrate-binding protein